jgi:catechol 2,3-dioxygenase-like lactoylglutathione lyase family enzyme
MFSHITVGCTDLDRAVRFYDAVLTPLGLRQRAVTPDGGPAMACWIIPDQALPKFFVSLPFDGHPATVGNGTMVAFRAPTTAAVDLAYAAGLLAGGSDEGPRAPGRTTRLTTMVPISGISTGTRSTSSIEPSPAGRADADGGLD